MVLGGEALDLWRLATHGASVVCLEQGDWPDRSNYPGASDEWELRAWTEAVRKQVGDDPRRQLVALFDVLDELTDTWAFVFWELGVEFRKTD